MASVKYTIEEVLEHILGIEGLFSDNPADSGGATKYGITEALARKYDYTGDMQDLSLHFAKDIYYKEFINPLQVPAIIRLNEGVAYRILDFGINCGTWRAASSLQRSLNVLNNKQNLYPDLKVDGQLGPRTLEAFKAYDRHREDDKGDEVLTAMLTGLQLSFYVELAERREKDEAFVFGWVKNRII